MMTMYYHVRNQLCPHLQQNKFWILVQQDNNFDSNEISEESTVVSVK